MSVDRSDQTVISPETAREFERGRTQRYALVCGTICICMGFAAWTVQVLTRPAWLEIMGYIFGPAGVLVVLVKAWQVASTRLSQRIEALERIIEEQRAEIRELKLTSAQDAEP